MKILEFFCEPLSYGGQEAFIYNMYSNFTVEATYTFITPFAANNKKLISLIQTKKDSLISEDLEFDSPFRKINIIRTAEKRIRSEYDVIHIHSGSLFGLNAVAGIAKKAGVKKIVVHSHATGLGGFKYKLIKAFSDLLLEKNAHYFLACSLEAGKHKYSKRILGSSSFKIIKNGIELTKFKYSPEVRNKKRIEFGLNDKHTIIHVGRFSEEKNHIFLINVFREYLNFDPNGHLLLVGGAGPTLSKVKEMIHHYHLENNVSLLFDREDVNELLVASDIFVLPSLYEGLGIAAVEAQAAGLVTICSNEVPEEANVSHLFQKLDLELSPKVWAEFINSNINKQHEDVQNEIKKNGYDVRDCSRELESIYFEK